MVNTLRKLKGTGFRLIVLVCALFICVKVFLSDRKPVDILNFGGFVHRPTKLLPTNNTKVNRTPQKTCSQLLKENLDSKLTDILLNTLVKSCLKRNFTFENENAKESFQQLFADDMFEHVDCPQRPIGRPSIPRPLVALASMKNAGNMRIRHMIEYISGIQTGTLYNGEEHETVEGESVCPTDDAVILVETHEFGASVGRLFKPHCRRIGIRDLAFSKAIYILRNPFNTLVINYHHDTNKNMQVEPLDAFSGTLWRNVIRQQTQQWLHHVSWWLSSFKGHVHVLVYEKLVEQPAWEMFKLFRFLENPVTIRNMACLSEHFDRYYLMEREWWMTHNNMFVPATTSGIVDTVKRLAPLFDKYDIGPDIVQSYYRFDELK